MNTPSFFAARRMCALVLVCGLGLVACAGRSPETRLYALSPQSQAQSQTDKTGPRVSIGPVSLPAYLDKSNIVSRKAGSAQLEVAPFDQWAEALDEGAGRVLAAHMAARLESLGAIVFVQRSMLEYDWRATVNINRMDGQLGGELVLEANWSLIPNTGAAMREERTVINVPAGDTLDSLVNAHTQALEQLAERISQAFMQAASTDTATPRRRHK